MQIPDTLSLGCDVNLMAGPSFEEFAPAPDCVCPGCARERGSTSRPSVRPGGHPGARGARHALVAALAASSVLGLAATPAPALAARPVPAAPAAVDAGDTVGTPQGGAGQLQGGAAPVDPGEQGGAVARTTREAIIARARAWVAQGVPYSLTAFHSDGYRQDCSGFVSMAWGLGSNQWTGSLSAFGTRITKGQLRPGDILLFHNPADPEKGSHVTVFGGWEDSAHTRYTAYEQTPPGTRRQSTPYAYWTNSSQYVPYRPGNLASGAGGSRAEHGAFPGAAALGPGARGHAVTRLGELLVRRGGSRFYAVGPGPRWGGSDRRATRAFQRAQGWRGEPADGVPGSRTWEYLVTGRGKDIPAAPSSRALPRYPGADAFRPGRPDAAVTLLGRRLVEKGFGRFYAVGPGPRWGEADRRATEAFQRAQGWRGASADGHPGPETWRRLFS